MKKETIIQLNSLRFSYTDKLVLDINQWSIDPLDQVFLYGPSGSGKSTLLNLLSGILQPSSGSIEVLGQDLCRLNNHQRDQFRANNIGVIFQQFNLIPFLSVIDNIYLASSFVASKPEEKRIYSLMERLSLSKELLDQRADRLSVGQQQRVAIIRALVNAPKLLIADEPTSSLDNETRDDFASLLLDISKEENLSVIFVSHDRSLMSHFSRAESLLDINRVRQSDAV